MSTKVEFAVQMTCDSCVKSVKKSLDVPGVSSVDVNLDTNTVVVDSTLRTEEILQKLQSTGRKAVVKGYAGTSAAVCVLEIGSGVVKGVVRFMQVDPNTCIIDGTIDGLNPGKHGLFVNECGDISNGCNNIGECFNPKLIKAGGDERIYGDLGIVAAEEDGRASFRLADCVVKVPEIIGRSLVVTELPTGGNRLACGVIARSSGLFQNPKTICSCDGITIWDEKNSPK
ncbi:copper chaperone for superoxide dismutase [Agrilus planipennis]|uniref:superoxide dismutase n=1 Tax=Agrilus planipennis TaxID=224129 RepID=A0A1W4WYF7_AGRPL|nr:copper chaperone for superoxide dismutase [Agrilus planipennis]